MEKHGQHHGKDMDMMGKMSQTTASPHSNHGARHHMSFHTYLNDVLLVQDWQITTVTSVVLACLGTIILGILYEGLKLLRQELYLRVARDLAAECDQGRIRLRCHGLHIAQILLHMLQTFLSLILMLIFMTYNVYICLAVILGAGIGYAVFGCKRTYDLSNMHNSMQDDHCS